jgi:hypothetical protein
MRMHHIIAVTFSEFQVWYESGELRCNFARLLAVPLDEAGAAVVDPLRCQELLELMPHVGLEDEHSILLARLDLSKSLGPVHAAATPAPTALLHMGYLPSATIQTVQPLTERGGRLLASRLESYNLKLARPLCAEAVEGLWSEWSRRRSLRGAAALVDLTIAGSTFTASPALLEEACEAVRLANVPVQIPLPDKGLLANVLCYDRHKPITEAELGYVMDLGVVLRDRFDAVTEMQPMMESLRAFCKVSENGRKTLPDILSDPDLVRIFDACATMTQCPVQVPSLVLFLRWKYRSQREDAVSVPAILETVRQCSGKLPRPCLEQAVWLFGLYCRFDRFAAYFYASHPTDYVFLASHVPHAPCAIAEVVPESPSVPPPVVIRPPDPPNQTEGSVSQPTDQPGAPSSTELVPPSEPVPSSGMDSSPDRTVKTERRKTSGVKGGGKSGSKNRSGKSNVAVQPDLSSSTPASH